MAKLDVSKFDAFQHYTIFDGFRKCKVNRGTFISQLLQFEIETGCRVAFVDVNGYPIPRTRDGRNDIVAYHQQVADTAQTFILLPKQL